MALNHFDLMVIFLACFFMFQVSSKILIDLEKHETTENPLYLAASIGLFSSILTGAESLYKLVKIVEAQTCQEKLT